MEDPTKIKRSSKHLKDTLKVKVTLDENGKPVLVKPTKTLTILGIKLKGCKNWRIKKA